jgi:hypothetical protein
MTTYLHNNVDLLHYGHYKQICAIFLSNGPIFVIMGGGEGGIF